MYFVRAKMGIKSSTTEALRKFYEKDNYALLKKDSTFNDMITLAHFWEDVSNQDRDRFSPRILHRLFVLNYAPNGMWTYFVSVYRFSDKIKYYQGFTNSRNQKKEGTKNHELINLATAADFTEDDIRNRTSQIMTAFLTFLSENSLTK